ncbi:MAG TPA: TIGR04563 family protein [Kofleriaceae bacterium]|nr:TIGR04563 family protein [Kofleriaceae bacterium]
MADTDKRKQSLYFPEEMLEEIKHEAARLDRSLSWIIQRGWRFAREKVKAFPASNDGPDGMPDPREEPT